MWRPNTAAHFPSGTYLALADLNNDLLPDVVVADERELKIQYNGSEKQTKLASGNLQLRGLLLVDYDNDGWLDIVAYGQGIRLWRNLGKAGFKDVTSEVGLSTIGSVSFLVTADFDQDGDTDFIIGSERGLQFLRNDGGNANHQLKLQLVGNRSNSSGLGVQMELMSSGWRALRTLDRLPFEIGVGKHERIDVLRTKWSDLATTILEVPVQPKPMTLVELTVPAGSCPNLYAWDGKHFRFVTDILGASPMGLPVAPGHYVDSDPEELLALGNESQFPARNGAFEIRITEELREVLYLDEAKLLAVDHPKGTVVHPTSKMLPRKPFLPHELWTLHPLLNCRKLPAAMARMLWRNFPQSI